MTREEIIRLAKEHGRWVRTYTAPEYGGYFRFNEAALQALIDEAVAAEREACAKVCETRYMGDNNREDIEAKRCAAAIRARGGQ